MVAAAQPQIAIHQPALMTAQNRIAFISCVRIDIQAIGAANKTYDTETLGLALETYKDDLWRATRAGISKQTISTKCRKNYIRAINTSLEAIAAATRDNDGDNRQVAIEGYKKAYDLATKIGISAGTIRQQCHNAFYGCLKASLQALTLAVITGDHERRGEILVDWYEDDRHRMKETGFRDDVIDARMKNLMSNKLK